MAQGVNTNGSSGVMAASQSAAALNQQTTIQSIQASSMASANATLTRAAADVAAAMTAGAKDAARAVGSASSR